ncbi:DUF3892 domain-containing protein [Melittangium boletus]|uniref:DUF3892 domain-containing protein n=1 Tax=Melittangium boletus DSM 14713 TaxID=1294270 RepID=A0A250ING4_9BACT|nr:DUF3892 domain-containing protein [Melittangium boletus]ATB32731.1 hypothetical protein MEBOL_006220 [Melittangium boletus DSM 14713]
MASKWADYIITAVRFDTTGSRRIISLRVYPDEGSSLGESAVWSFEQVAQAILNGSTFVTATKNSNGKLDKGASVELSLRTRRDDTAKDNLDNLPTF